MFLKIASLVKLRSRLIKIYPNLRCMAHSLKRLQFQVKQEGKKIYIHFNRLPSIFEYLFEAVEVWHVDI